MQSCDVHEKAYVHGVVNNSRTVNGLAGTRLQREVAARLQTLLAEVSWAKLARLHTEGGGVLAMKVGGASKGPALLLVHAKSELRPSAFPAWVAARSLPGATQVLAMPVISRRLAEICRQHGWSWLDLAGNCCLDVPGVLHIERLGAPPLQRSPRWGGNLKSPAAARVLRVLLSPVHADRGWTQRTLQSATCDHLPGEKPVSLGLVNKIVRHLRDQGFVTAAGLRLRDPVGLLTAWREQYRLEDRQRLSCFTLSKPGSLDKAIDRLIDEFGAVCAYAAFSAADRQAPQVRQPRTWVYVREDHLDDFLRVAEAKPVDSGENLMVLLPGDPGVLQAFGASRPGSDAERVCTDPVQTYLDLATLGGRGQEAAEAVLAERLLPDWKSAGLA